MTNQGIAKFKTQNLIMAMMIAVGSTMTIPSAATAISLKVSVENLAPTNGIDIAQFWFAFHDGSVDTFNVGEAALPAIEILAEDGLTGLEGGIPGLLEDALAAGLDPTKLPSPNATLAGLFAGSPASLNGGTQGLAFANVRKPFFLAQAPGQTVTTTIALNGSVTNNRFFSYAAMLFPTNDGFIGNDNPKAIEIFDSQGNFIGADFIVFGNQVWDAGTEVNDEDPSTLQYTLKEFGNSVDENGTIQLHPSLKPSGAGGILDFELNGEKFFANADFTVPGYQVARVTVTQIPESVPEPAITTGLFALSGLFLLRRRVRPAK